MSSILSTDAIGTQRWTQDGLPHRDDGPALIFVSGTECWYFRGALHRMDGPAIILDTGTIYWFINGEHVRTGQRYRELTGLSDEELSLLVLKYGMIEQVVL